MSLRVNSLGVNTQSSSDSATTLISNRALIDHNYEGIVTSAGAVTKWLNTAGSRDQRLYCDGVNDNLSTPDSAALTLTGATQTWEFYGVAAVDWTPAANSALGSQWSSGQLSWLLYVLSGVSGGIYFNVSTDGITPTGPLFSSPSFVNGQSYDIKVERVASSGLITCSTRPTGGTYTVLGSASGATGALFNSTAALKLGTHSSTTAPYNGTLQRFRLYDDDRLAASWSADDYTDYNATTMESIGPDLVVNGAFDTDTNWTKSAGVTISDGVATFTVGGDRFVYQDIMEIGGVYDITANYNIVSGPANLYIGSNSGTGAAIISLSEELGVGVVSGRITASSARFIIRDGSGGSATFDNVTVKRVTTWTLNNGAIIRDPYDMDVLLGTGGLRRHDSGAVLLDGVSGSYVSTPDSAAASVTGDITLIAYAALDDWTPPTDDRTLIGKFVTSGVQRSYLFRVELTTGLLEVITSVDGGTLVATVSSVAPSFVDGTGHWVRGTINLAADTANFYTSDDAKETAYSDITWTQLGTERPHVQTAIFDSTAVVTIGAWDGGTTDMVNGQIYRACVIDGILPQGLDFGENILPDEGDWTGYFGGAVTGTQAVTLTITEDGVDGSAARMSKAVTTVVGVKYIVEASVAAGNAFAKIAASNNANGTAAIVTSGNFSVGDLGSLTFTATSTVTYIILFPNATGAGFFTTWENISVKPTAAIAVDFDARLAGLTAGAGDSFFGAEMLKPSARTVNATDWTQAGSGSITDNGDGTVTLSDTDNGGSVAAWANDNTVANDSTKRKLTVTIKEGTALATDVRLTYTGGTTVSAQYRYTWATGVLSTVTAGVSGEAKVNSDGSVTVTVVAQNNSTGNTTCSPRLYPATSLGSTQGSTIFYNNVSLQAEWTLNGGAKIQNSGQAVVQAGGVGGIETTVAPPNIPTPMTMFMVGKADVLNSGLFSIGRDNISAGPYLMAGPSGEVNFVFNAGTSITRTSDTSLHLHTIRHNGDATTSYQIDSGTPVVGNAGAEEYNFGTFFANVAGSANYLTGSMGRFLLFDEELSDAEVEFIQTLLLPN